jgi:hypothetical protein
MVHWFRSILFRLLRSLAQLNRFIGRHATLLTVVEGCIVSSSAEAYSNCAAARDDVNAADLAYTAFIHRIPRFEIDQAHKPADKSALASNATDKMQGIDKAFVSCNDWLARCQS